jgi:hypothetical protein
MVGSVDVLAHAARVRRGRPIIRVKRFKFMTNAVCKRDYCNFPRVRTTKQYPIPKAGAHMRASLIRHLASALMAASAWPALAGVCAATSPAHRVALVELYTSEGCSSCPPADRWLSQFDRARQSDAAVPLALHVDYWDSLGWKDRFAQPAFTGRQQRLSNVGGQRVVYTPEVFVAGRELRDWSDASSVDARVKRMNAEAPLADIRIETSTAATGRLAFDAEFAARPKLPAEAVAYAAVVESGLQSQVQAGENQGALLHHDRVVRRWIGPVRIVDGHAKVSGEYAKEVSANARYSVVAFVENSATGEVLQVAEAGCGG